MILTFSSHFKRSIGLLAVSAAVLVGLFVRARNKVERDLPTSMLTRSVARSTILAKNDKEAVSYNSSTHELTIVTSSKTASEYTRDPVIHVQKDGTVKIDRKLFGLEFSPFIGVGYSDRFNTYVGLNLLDVWRFDAGVALAYSPGSTRPLLLVGCNVWRNSSVNVGIDNSKTPHLFLSVNF